MGRTYPVLFEQPKGRKFFGHAPANYMEVLEVDGAELRNALRTVRITDGRRGGPVGKSWNGRRKHEDQQSLFAYLSRMRFIQRWALMRNTAPENVQGTAVRWRCWQPCSGGDPQ